MRPSRVADFGAIGRLEAQSGASYAVFSRSARDAALVGSAGYTAIAERVRATPAPEGAWEANPLHARYGVMTAAAGRSTSAAAAV